MIVRPDPADHVAGVTMVSAGEAYGEGDARQAGFHIHAEERDGWVVVAFAGELDLEEYDRAREALDRARGSARTGVTADLREVTFLGSTGIRVLLEARDATLAAGLRSGVVQGDGPACRLIELLGLTERLDVVDVRE